MPYLLDREKWTRLRSAMADKDLDAVMIGTGENDVQAVGGGDEDGTRGSENAEIHAGFSEAEMIGGETGAAVSE